jgi:hypothetical protein
VLRSQKLSWDSQTIRGKVLSFSRERFLQEMKDYIGAVYQEGPVKTVQVENRVRPEAQIS